MCHATPTSIAGMCGTQMHEDAWVLPVCRWHGTVRTLAGWRHEGTTRAKFLRCSSFFCTCSLTTCRPLLSTVSLSCVALLCFAHRHGLLVHRLHRHLALLGHQGARAVAGGGAVRLLIGGLPCDVVVPANGEHVPPPADPRSKKIVRRNQRQVDRWDSTNYSKDSIYDLGEGKKGLGTPILKSHTVLTHPSGERESTDFRAKLACQTRSTPHPG